MDALIVGRVLCGFGGAGMYAGSIVLLSVNTSDQERSAYLGLVGISWGLGTCLGPIVGGGFAESSATWRWSLYINVCVGAVAAPIYLFLIPSHDPQKGKSLKERIAALDMVGAILIAGVYLTGVMAISFGGVLYEWDSGRIIALFVLFGLLSIAFTVQQVFCLGVTAENRLFPMEFAKSPFLMNMFWQTATAATTVFIPIYFIPLYFAFVRGDSPLDAGVRLLPYIVPLVFVCIANGYAMSYFGYYTPWYYFAGATTLAGCALLATIDAHSSLALIYGASALVGLGSGATVQSSFSVAQVRAPELAEASVGVLTNAQLGGPAFALSIANAYFLNKATAGLRPLLPGESTEAIQGIISGIGLESFSNELQEQIVEVIVENMRETFYMPMVAGAITLLLSFFLKWEKIF
ncbi:pentafunctional AROM polypeptide [Neofusicoccum parvum]|nr:pentafunctional AROM polypeptide [Neofusicoccum parvum]